MAKFSDINPPKYSRYLLLHSSYSDAIYVPIFGLFGSKWNQVSEGRYTDLMLLRSSFNSNLRIRYPFFIFMDIWNSSILSLFIGQK